MSLKAGRVGVAPDQVDEFGNIISDATDGYTKQEADAKFETKTAVSEALALKQPVLLEVPIKMLSGTQLTVEGALNAINGIDRDQQLAIETLQGISGTVYSRKLISSNNAHTVHCGFTANYPFMFIIIGRDASWAGYMVINTEWNQTVNAVKVFENATQNPISETLSFTYVDATHFDIHTSYTGGIRYFVWASQYPTLTVVND